MILTEIQNRTLIITLNRPEKRNALNNELVSELKQTLLQAKENVSLKCVLIQAEGKSFSAGADLDSLQQLQQQSYEQNLTDSTHLAELFELIYTHPLPIISAVGGDAIAGGCGLATVCDVVIAKKTARFGYTEVRIGFIPAIVSFFLTKKVGDTRARELALSGVLISADRAEQIGLITESVAEDAFNERILYWTELFENKVSRSAVSLTKELLSEANYRSLSSFLSYAAEQNAKARALDDCKRGVSAFLSKEKITW